MSLSIEPMASKAPSNLLFLDLATEPTFKLTCEDGTVFNYKPHSNLLLDDSGHKVSLSRLNGEYTEAVNQPVFPVSPENPGLKAKISRLKISMGFKCNYSCSYCSQAFHRYVDKKREAGDIEAFIEKIKKIIPVEKRGRGARFEFWGGEPFVYWNIFKPLAESIRALYPDADFMTITNGSLLDDEKVEWLDKMNFGVGISHDGPGYHFRGKDPLDDPSKCEHVRKLFDRLAPKNKASFNCVLSVPNPSMKKIYEYLEEKLGVSGFQLSTEGITSQYEPAIAQLVPKTEEEMRMMWRQIFQDAADVQHLAFNATFKQSIQDFFMGLSQGRMSNSVGQKCGMDRPDSLAVDLDGNATTCQNVSVNAGHGIGKMDDLENVRLTTAKHWSNFENCRNCPVVQLCKGSCMYLDGPTRRPVCDGHFTFNFALFASALFILTGKKLKRIEGDRVRIEGLKQLDF